MDENNLRKAAVLVSALDRDTATQLLRQLRPSQAARVRLAADQLSDVSASERQKVLNEFMHRGAAVGPPAAGALPATGDVALDESLAQKLAASAPTVDAGPLANHAKHSAPCADPCDALHHADGAALAPLLAGEHPQTIAVVLSRMSATSAAEVLTRLHPRLQATVARRLLDLDEADPEILQEIERELESTLREKLHSVQRRHAGAQTLQKIIHAAPTNDRDRLLENLRKYDMQLHQDVPRDSSTSRDDQRRRVPVNRQADFEPTKAPSLLVKPLSGEESSSWDLSRVAELADDALRHVLKQMDPEVALLALIGANQAVVDRVMTQFPAPLANHLQRQLTEIAPTHLRDVELARKEMVARAAHVAETAV